MTESVFEILQKNADLFLKKSGREGTIHVPSLKKSTIAMQDIGPKLWAELHSTVTVETLSEWESRIPSYGCPCLDSYKKWKRERPPEQEPDFFAWTVWLHNKVNHKLGRQPISMDDAMAMWQDKPPMQSDKLIVTIATGEQYKKLLDLTGPTHRSYAERVGADYIQLTNQLYNDWKQEKFRAGVVGQHYDQTLFVDCDVIIRSTCPDVFQVGGVYIHDDAEKLRMLHWFEQDIKNVASSQCVDPWHSTRCLNTGFFTFTKKDNPWVMPTKPFPDSHCAEQWWVDRHVTKYTRMEPQMNCQWWFHDFWEMMDDAHVVHLSNCPKPIRIPVTQAILSSQKSAAIKERFYDEWKKSASL